MSERSLSGMQPPGSDDRVLGYARDCFRLVAVLWVLRLHSRMGDPNENDLRGLFGLVCRMGKGSGRLFWLLGKDMDEAK